MAAVSGLQQWEELRRRALRLENEVDSKLIAYNKVITEVTLIFCPCRSATLYLYIQLVACYPSFGWIR
jgi:hypothetical protein